MGARFWRYHPSGSHIEGWNIDIPEDGIEVVPTLRIVNVGFAF